MVLPTEHSSTVLESSSGATFHKKISYYVFRTATKHQVNEQTIGDL